MEQFPAPINPAGTLKQPVTDVTATPNIYTECPSYCNLLWVNDVVHLRICACIHFKHACFSVGHIHVAMLAPGGSWGIWSLRLSSSLTLSSFSPSISQPSKLQKYYCHTADLPHAHILCYCPERYKIDGRCCSSLGCWWKAITKVIHFPLWYNVFMTTERYILVATPT